MVYQRFAVAQFRGIDMSQGNNVVATVDQIGDSAGDPARRARYPRQAGVEMPADAVKLANATLFGESRCSAGLVGAEDVEPEST